MKNLQIRQQARLALAALGATLALCATAPSRADTIYASFKGQKSGAISDDSANRNLKHAGFVDVLRLQHEIVSPRDVASGLPTGRRQHRPIVLTHAFGPTAVHLLNVLATNENLTEVTIQVWAPSVAGNEVLKSTIKLTNANVASASTMSVAQGSQVQVLQEVTLTYQRIEVTDVLGKVVMVDDYLARQ